MIQTLIIYDLEGVILQLQSGQPTPRIPVGVPSLLIEIPQGKYAVKVDVTKEVHEVVFEDLPPSEIDLVNKKLDNAVLELTTLIAMGGL